MANEIFEKVSGQGVMANMMIYLGDTYHMGAAAGQSVLFIYGAVASILPVFGAFLADSYWGRYRVILIGSVACLLGTLLVWLTAMLPGAKPPACQSPNPSQLALLFCGFALLGIGEGGVRPCSIAFGADQFSQRKGPEKQKILQTYFNWYYASVGFSFVVGSTVIVAIQDNFGWKVGYAVPLVLILLATILFVVASSLYINVEAEKSMLTGLLQVIFVSLKHRNLVLPPKTSDASYYHETDSKLMVPSDKLRFFNKACIIKNPTEHLNVDGSASKKRNLCTVEQVEGLKSVMRVIPLWSSGIVVPLVLNQSFPVLQAKTMDRHIFSKFEIPAGSFGVFGTLTLTVWSGSYDRFIVPVLEKITRRPRAFSLKQRMGIGILISTVSTGVAAIVEAIRRRKAIEQGLADDMNGVVTMSAMWLVPQHCLSGLAEAFSVISQIEFYYTELPSSMASFGVAFWTLGAGLANLLGVLVLKIVTRTTRGRNGRGMWLSTNLNKGHYDYYYWVLTLMGVVDFFYFLVCSWAYGKEGKNRMREEVGDDDEEESMQHSNQLPILR